MLEKYFPHAMKSYREGLIPFPHAELLSLVDKSRVKINIFPLVCTLQAIQQAYTQVVSLQATYIRSVFPKIHIHLFSLHVCLVWCFLGGI
jgi:hypothetical protein